MKFGWIPDKPDFRDYTPKTTQENLPRMVNPTYASARVDLRETGFFSPVEQQGDLGSCTAQAVTGILEYCERKSFGKYMDHSRLFLYRVARKLYFKARGTTSIGDTGCEIRTTIKALAAVGSPPEWVWPYKESEFDKEPSQDAYALAQTYKGLYYVKLNTLEEIKAFIRIKLPVALGFTCYESIDGLQVEKDGKIPIPAQGERLVGSHAVVAAGYDDTTNALLIRNSWGPHWGEGGYGYLPYWYFENKQAEDFWALLRSGWVEL